MIRILIAQQIESQVQVDTQAAFAASFSLSVGYHETEFTIARFRELNCNLYWQPLLRILLC